MHEQAFTGGVVVESVVNTVLILLIYQVSAQHSQRGGKTILVIKRGGSSFFLGHSPSARHWL